MKTFSVIVAEDNPADRDSILRCIAQCPELRLDGIALDGGEAVALLRRVPCELLFLDIDIPVISGFDVLKIAGRYLPPYVIITSAWPDFAIKAFDHAVLDFLVKPYTIERFTLAVKRFFVRRALETREPTPDSLGVYGEESYSRSSPDFGADPDSRILTLHGKGYHWYINLDKIIYLSAHGRCSDIHCHDGDKVVSSLLNDILAKLSQDSFIRVHRQYAVNLRYVASMAGDFAGRHTVRLLDVDGTELPVGRAYIQSLRERLA